MHDRETFMFVIQTTYNNTSYFFHTHVHHKYQEELVIYHYSIIQHKIFDSVLSFKQLT